MAIEFRCPQCGKLLRTDDDTAGKQAQCPACGTVTPIPNPGEAASGPSVPPSENPYQSPQPFTPIAPQSDVPQHDITPTIIDLNDIFARTWAIFKEQWPACLSAWIIVLMLNFAITYGVIFFGTVVGQIFFGPKIARVFAHMSNLISQLVSIWIGIGAAIYFLKIARGQTPELSDLFKGGPYYIPILSTVILFLLIVYGGMLLLIVPGVIFALMFSQVYYLVLDRQLPVLEAFGLSRTLTRGNKATLFLIWLACAGISLLALIPCCLGFFIVGPFFALMFPVIYLSITGQPIASPRQN
jgi:phage FluMu protein Com